MLRDMHTATPCASLVFASSSHCDLQQSAPTARHNDVALDPLCLIGGDCTLHSLWSTTGTRRRRRSALVLVLDGLPRRCDGTSGCCRSFIVKRARLDSNFWGVEITIVLVQKTTGWRWKSIVAVAQNTCPSGVRAFG